MRISCCNLNDFLINLNGAGVFRKTIYFNTTVRSLNAGQSIREATSKAIGLQVTTILDYEEDDGQALLECGIECGVDRLTADGGSEGTEELKAHMTELRHYCSQNGLQLRPGLLQI